MQVQVDIQSTMDGGEVPDGLNPILDGILFALQNGEMPGRGQGANSGEQGANSGELGLGARVLSELAARLSRYAQPSEKHSPLRLMNKRCLIIALQSISLY